MRRTPATVVAGGAGGGGEEACSGGAADKRGGAAAGAREGADAARGRQQGRLLWRVPQRPGKVSKPYQAMVTRGGGEQVCLGRFVTAEEAALCVARSPEGQEVAKSEEARTAKKRPVAAAALASEGGARHV